MRREHVRPPATLVLVAIFTASLAYPVELTRDRPAVGLLPTLTRLWEFAFDGLLALHVDRLVLTRPHGSSWGGDRPCRVPEVGLGR